MLLLYFLYLCLLASFPLDIQLCVLILRDKIDIITLCILYNIGNLKIMLFLMLDIQDLLIIGILLIMHLRVVELWILN